MKRIALWLLKVGVSGLLAFTVLTCFCMIYYNVPVHHSTTDGATDYSWESNKFYSRATEGFAWGKTNNEGYLNSFDYSNDTKIDILVMGSSHMEAYQVAMDESTAAVLGNLLPDRTVYNIGTSGHSFLTCVDNFAAAIEKYKPSEYVLLEIYNLYYTDEQLISAINETIPDLPSYNHGIIGMLQKNSFFRLLYSQLKGFSDDSDEVVNSEKNSIAPIAGSKHLYDELFSKLSDTASSYGAQLIIIYHPHLSINDDGSVVVTGNRDHDGFFADICKTNNISFLDMSDIFIMNYNKEHILPHGFTNTSIGSGHLNQYGHEMIANAVYELIMGEK